MPSKHSSPSSSPERREEVRLFFFSRPDPLFAQALSFYSRPRKFPQFQTFPPSSSQAVVNRTPLPVCNTCSLRPLTPCFSFLGTFITCKTFRFFPNCFPPFFLSNHCRRSKSPNWSSPVRALESMLFNFPWFFSFFFDPKEYHSPRDSMKSLRTSTFQPLCALLNLCTIVLPCPLAAS